MRLVVLASVCARARRRALADLLAVPGRTLLGYARDGESIQRSISGRGVMALGDGVQPLVLMPSPDEELRDAVAADLAVALVDLTMLPVDEVVIVLPEALDAAVAIAAITAAGHLPDLCSVGVALDPALLEDTLRMTGSLTDAGLAMAALDLRTRGDFLVSNLLWADTVALVAGPARGSGLPGAVRLLSHVAPHALAMHIACRRFRWSGFDPREAVARTRPGALSVPMELIAVEGVSTALYSYSRPLHPQRLLEHLTTIRTGALFSRGKAWIASAPERRVAWCGIGPHLGLTDGGPWLSGDAVPGLDTPTQHALDWRPGLGDRGSALAFTGPDLDTRAITTALDASELDDEEYTAFVAGSFDVISPALLTIGQGQA